ncbi:MAG: assimilatory sulfite reductase (NADPH) flavoprotein subunit [Xanthomonadales bacterium]|nr:assimilatory sulfite reductase (NADPH) flavoprotein subunit [Xanthomonadales bacterium]
MSPANPAATLSTLPQTPLSAEPYRQIAHLVEGLDTAGLWWLSGYAAGLARAQGAVPLASVGANADSVAADHVERTRLTVVYGSQTGNARRIAEALFARLEADGLPVRLLRADAYQTRELKDERFLAIVISTQGDGDPPDDARALVEFIEGKRAPSLPQLRFTVLGLGDSSYPQFCAIGQRLDARFEALGAQRWVARADADLDIDSVATPWSSQLYAEAKEALKPRPQLASVTALRPHTAPVAWTRERPFAAELLANQRITGRGSDRDIRHLELSLEGAGLDYEPGDALGVWIENPPALVQAIAEALDLDADAAVEHGGDTRTLREWLGSKREITRLSRPFVATHAAHAGSDALNRLLAPDQREGLTALMAKSQIIDLLQEHPGVWTAEALVEALRPLQPRLYSIASSRKAVGDEAHLTVAHVEYRHGDALRWGAASHYLANREEGASLPVFIERNERFRLPTDTSRDVIMIGPGTGVAPFRGFVQERAVIGATGRQWLLFGNPHARSDFLYQLEWQDALKRGELHRLDLAFSRDQAHKVYVQDRLREHGRELFSWLESGAHLYVCGDATRMAKDVHAALLEAIAEHGGKSAEDATDYLNALQSQGRYARDVY